MYSEARNVTILEQDDYAYLQILNPHYFRRIFKSSFMSGEAEPDIFFSRKHYYYAELKGFLEG